MPGEPKRQHTVPRFLLSQFTNEGGRLHCFDKERERGYVSSPYNVFLEGHIYTLRHPARADSYGMEEALAKLEGKASGIIEHIIESTRRRKVPSLSGSDKEVLDAFVITQWRRVSERLRGLQSDSREEIMEEAISQAERVFPDREVRSEVGLIERNRIFRNSCIRALAFEPPDWLSAKGLAVLLSPPGNSTLIIGSNPVLLAGHDRREPDGEVMLPVASDVVISLAGEAGQERLIVDDRARKVREINTHVFQQSDLVAAASHHSLGGLVRAFRKRRRKERRRRRDQPPAD